MKHNCPNLNCKFYQEITFIVKDGTYYRQEDARKINRFKCTACGKRFSATTNTLEWRQKKRRVNYDIFNLLSMNVSMRDTAKYLKIHYITVAKKLVYLAQKSRIERESLFQQLQQSPVTHLKFNDLITVEHTKLKPLSVSVAVDANRRFILGATVARIPSFGHLAKFSRKKYGRRKSEHRQQLSKLLGSLQPVMAKDLTISTDKHNLYPELIVKFFPEAKHRTYKGGRGCVAGQGELKKLHFDPLFEINQTCAMLRAKISRLIRRTWCISKKPERLQCHLDLYLQFFNEELLKKNNLQV